MRQMMARAGVPVQPHPRSTRFARGGGADTFPAMLTAEHLETHRGALTGHCYRMLGSVAEADDAVQETMVRAWRNLDRFEGRSSVRTWLYRIATRACLDALEARARRERPMEIGPAGTVDDALVPLPAERWIEPIPDAHALPADADPAALVALRQSIRLAFVAAMQHLPPKQRAALILTEVLGWSAAEVAETLETTVAAINSALQRARATLATRNLEPAPLSDGQAALVDRYVEAFARYDVDALAGLLHEDAILSMPPFPLWLQGPATIATWLRGRGAGCRGSRLLPVAACGSPAFAQWRAAESGEGFRAFALIVLETAGDRITGWNSFLDVETLFPRFGLPLELFSKDR
jgi:RNA polymerase sigma-70 factor (ECF subfamily)